MAAGVGPPGTAVSMLLCSCAMKCVYLYMCECVNAIQLYTVYFVSVVSYGYWKTDDRICTSKLYTC